MCSVKNGVDFIPVALKVETNGYSLLGKLDDEVQPVVLTSQGGFAVVGAYGDIVDMKTPDGATMIWHSAFEGCQYLEGVEIQDSVENIGMCAFKDCPRITKVEVPSKVEKIESNTF
jgi:hypothetical protein